MVKHVVDKRMVAHLWWAQSQDSARTSTRNFSFQGRKLYSYSTLVGQIVDGKDGLPYAILTSRKYSVTTTAQMSTAADAVSDAQRVFWLDDVASDYDVMRLLERGHTELVQNARFAINKLATCRMGTYAAGYSQYNYRRDVPAQSKASTAVNTANRFAEVFGVPPVDLSAEFLSASGTFMLRRANYEAQPAVAERRTEAERMAAVREERDAAARAERYAKDTETRAAWLTGANVSYHGATLQGSAYMRIQGDELQTSLGARVPLEDAKRVFKLIRRVKETGHGWFPGPSGGLSVGQFQVDHIAADGTMRAGCHLMRWPEIEAVARQAGVYP